MSEKIESYDHWQKRMNKNFYIWDNTDIWTFLVQVEDMIKHGYGEDVHLKIDNHGIKIDPRYCDSCYYTPHGQIFFDFSTVIL